MFNKYLNFPYNFLLHIAKKKHLNPHKPLKFILIKLFLYLKLLEKRNN